MPVLASNNIEQRTLAALLREPYHLKALSIPPSTFFTQANKIAFSMLERTSYANVQSNPKAAYMFIEKGQGYKGKRLYLKKSGEETDPHRIEEIKSHRPKRHESTTESARHFVYFSVENIRAVV